MDRLDKKEKIQQLQDDAYAFPYHYVPDYDDFTETYHVEGGIHYISAIEFILQELKEIPFFSLADMGTGDGRLVRELAGHFPDKEICGIDYSKRAIDLARALNPQLRFIQQDVIEEPQGHHFDVITLVEVFEHIPMDKASVFAQRLAEMLRENGYLLLTVPHANKPLLDKHFQHFTQESLFAYFQPYFELEEVVHFEKKNFLTILIQKVLYNKLFILNNKGIKNALYRFYKRKCFKADQKSGRRLYFKLRKKKGE